MIMEGSLKQFSMIRCQFYIVSFHYLQGSKIPMRRVPGATMVTSRAPISDKGYARRATSTVHINNMQCSHDKMVHCGARRISLKHALQYYRTTCLLSII